MLFPGVSSGQHRHSADQNHVQKAPLSASRHVAVFCNSRKARNAFLCRQFAHAWQAFGVFQEAACTSLVGRAVGMQSPWSALARLST